MSQACGPSTLSSSPPVMKPKSSLQVLHDSAQTAVSYSVFYWKQDKTSIEIKLPDSGSIRDMIQATISELALNHHIILPASPDSFKIYAAKKTGKKKSDLPCLDPSQKVQKTKINFFCLEKRETVLMEVNPEQNPSPIRLSKGSVKKEKSSMVSGYDPLSAKKIPSSKEIPPSKGIGCFCWTNPK